MDFTLSFLRFIKIHENCFDLDFDLLDKTNTLILLKRWSPLRTTHWFGKVLFQIITTWELAAVGCCDCFGTSSHWVICNHLVLEHLKGFQFETFKRWSKTMLAILFLECIFWSWRNLRFLILHFCSSLISFDMFPLWRQTLFFSHFMERVISPGANMLGVEESLRPLFLQTFDWVDDSPWVPCQVDYMEIVPGKSCLKKGNIQFILSYLFIGPSSGRVEIMECISVMFNRIVLITLNRKNY